MTQCIKNIYQLGIKELRGFVKDPVLMCLIIFSFTIQIITIADASKDSIHDAAIAVVDEDNSQLSQHLVDSLIPPHFIQPIYISNAEIDEKLDSGVVTFVLVFPHNFQKDVLAGYNPAIQLNVDATRMSQAFIGSGYIQTIFSQELARFLSKDKAAPTVVNLVTRNRFNSNLTSAWFGAIMQIVSSITMLAIILTGSAIIRERERGTLEHLMVLPITPFQIMASKIWSMGVIVLIATTSSMLFIIRGYLGIPILGSVPLFLLGTALHIFAVTSIGIFLACVAQSMPQLGMLMILVLIPMDMLSGGSTPQESMPEAIRFIMAFSPTTHFVALSQTVLFRGAGLDVVWKQFAWLFGIGAVLFSFSLTRFRKSLAS